MHQRSNTPGSDNAHAFADFEWRITSQENYDAPRDVRTPRQVRRNTRANMAAITHTGPHGETVRISGQHFYPHQDVTIIRVTIYPNTGEPYRLDPTRNTIPTELPGRSLDDDTLHGIAPTVDAALAATTTATAA